MMATFNTVLSSLNHFASPAGSGSEDPQDRYSNSGISVLIIGGGVAGLYLALECVRQGHNPTVIESKPEGAQPDGKPRYTQLYTTCVFKRHFTDYRELKGITLC